MVQCTALYNTVFSEDMMATIKLQNLTRLFPGFALSSLHDLFPHLYTAFGCNVTKVNLWVPEKPLLLYCVHTLAWILVQRPCHTYPRLCFCNKLS